MITFGGFTYAYPTSTEPVLRDIDVELPEGGFYGLIGPSGAGKSTFAYAASGFIPHVMGGEHTGTVTVAGLPIAATELPDLVFHVGLVLQNPFNQISGAKFSVREELAFGLENLGVERGEMAARVEEILRLLRIEELAERSPYELSGGQQQLVAIGSMLVLRPTVLILDEPTSQLDPAGSRLVFDALAQVRETGMTVLLIEHKLEQLHEYAERILTLVDGRIVLDGTPDEVLTDPRLAEWRIGGTRFTEAARRAAERGLWPADRPLPVSLVDTVAGFGGREEVAR